MPLAFWGDGKAILALEKTGQFMVRTHVQKYQQNLKKLPTMSGVLNSGQNFILTVEFY
jgi:hypothetical protein